MNNDTTPPKEPSSPAQAQSSGGGKSSSDTADKGKGKPDAGDSGRGPDKPSRASDTAPTGSGNGRATTGKQKAKARRGWGGKLLVLVILLALGAASWYLWPQYGDTLKTRLSAMVSNNADSTTASIDRETGSDPAVAASESEQSSAREADTGPLNEALPEPAADDNDGQALRAEVESRLAKMELRLNSVQQQVREMAATTRTDWLLAEAEYLLRLASQRLLIERQTANALGLMESADAILQELDDVDLFAVRKALAEDMTRLRMAGVVDREGLYLQLEALIAVAQDLSVPLPRASAPEPEPETAPEPGAWYQRLADNAWSALRSLAGLVRVERRDVPQAPMVTLEEEALLRYNLRGMLEQAQLALMQEEQAVYDAALTKARRWVESAFAEDTAASGFIAQLAELQEQQVVQPLPSANTSLKALKDYVDLRHSRGDGAGGRQP